MWDTRKALAGATLLAFLLSGCTVSGHHVEVVFQGSGPGRDSKSLDCGPTAHLAWGVQGDGKVHVQVLDGDGTSRFDRTFDGDAQSGEAQTLDGTEGSWTLVVERGDPSGFGGFGSRPFSGQYGITLSC